MTTARDAVDTVEVALVAAGVRVATTAADVTPPCAHLVLYADDPAEAFLAGDCPVTVAVNWVPIRGTQDAYADADARDTIYAALAPVGALTAMARTTVTVNEQTSWPCLRWEITVQ